MVYTVISYMKAYKHMYNYAIVCMDQWNFEGEIKVMIVSKHWVAMTFHLFPFTYVPMYLCFVRPMSAKNSIVHILSLCRVDNVD